jgi:hypothetical protein
MKFLIYLCATSLTLIAISKTSARGQEQSKSISRPLPIARKGSADVELARLRAEVIEKTKQSRAQSAKLLALYEQEQARLTQEYQERRSLYAQGLISRAEVIAAEAALAKAISRVLEVKRWILEDDSAITEATLRDELLRLPALAIGGYSETASLIRFNGSALWSLKDAPNVEKFFSQTFGRALPVSAFGQTSLHERMKFDHRDAMDVALHPDSTEGRSLIAYLRQVGIPFVAFRSAIPGSATGAHIHIGKPSVRNSHR